MKEHTVATKLGNISVAVDEEGKGKPILFLHGVFLDRSLWADYGTELTGRPHVYVDMPAHGHSANVGRDWHLDDCAEMLMAIMDELHIDKSTVVGHSWGSMTALRAAHKHPDRFTALGLFNMPHRRTAGLRRVAFMFQKAILPFPRFYAKQAAKALYSKQLLQQRPELSTQMQTRLAKRSAAELARVVNAVILEPDDATPLLQDLKVPTLAVVGETDYVGKPPRVESWVVPGAHISPHESPAKTREALRKIAVL